VNDLPEKHPRRLRYKGRNPRNFADKYKEHQADLYPEDISKIVGRGQTPAGMHRPIMVSEILHALELIPGNVVVDCTLGYGGHACEMLAAIQPGGHFLGVDMDPLELPKTETRLRSSVDATASIEIRRMNFAGMAAFLAAQAPEGVDALLADLGVSSMQLDDPKRGFSFKVDGPLDMRMNPNRGISAHGLLSSLNSSQLSALLVENSDEPNADATAQSILKSHAQKPIESTLGLVAAIRLITSRLTVAESELTVRRVFQSLRIAVNDELRTLDAFLRQLPFFMKSGGRIAILTFHSGEDRRVKASFKQGLLDGHYRFISQEVIRASAAEQRANARSSSAKLRIAVRM
jgi:16S rRNA (cytosine1402-N4)-methyltransferase